MRTVIVALSALLLVSVFGMAVFAQAIGGNCSGCYDMGIYGDSACCGPGYCGPLVPGCCEYAPSCCCDDIWAGYCQEKGGCCCAAICAPCLRYPSLKTCFSSSCQTAPVCAAGCQPACTDGGSCNVQQGTSAQPAPRVKAITPVPPMPQEANPPKSPPSPPKATSAWRFMPAGDAFTR